MKTLAPLALGLLLLGCQPLSRDTCSSPAACQVGTCCGGYCVAATGACGSGFTYSTGGSTATVDCLTSTEAAACQPGGPDATTVSDAALPAIDAAPDAGALGCGAVTVTTLAGGDPPALTDGTGGPTGTARFNRPGDIADDGAGGYYVTDSANNALRHLAADGTTTTVVGPNGMGQSPFSEPMGLVNSAGVIYVVDRQHHRVVSVVGGAVTLVAGSGTAGWNDGANGQATFSQPLGLAIDSAGALYVADYGNHAIRKIAGGQTTTLAGQPPGGYADGTGGRSGSARLHNPEDVVVDAAGVVYVADQANFAIRRIAPNGDTTTLVGGGGGMPPVPVDGPAGVARLGAPFSLVLLPDGSFFVSEGWTIRHVALDGAIVTLAGALAMDSFVDGDGCSARFRIVSNLLFVGNRLLATDFNNARIRVIALP